MFLTPPERARTRSAFFVGGLFPDLQASRKSVMTSGQALQFEDSSKNLGRHDEMLCRALGLKGNFLQKLLKVFVLASSFFQPGAFELTGAKVTVRHPGYKMSLLEDTGWTKQISKEIAKEQPSRRASGWSGSQGSETGFLPFPAPFPLPLASLALPELVAGSLAGVLVRSLSDSPFPLPFSSTPFGRLRRLCLTFSAASGSRGPSSQWPRPGTCWPPQAPCSSPTPCRRPW